MHSYNICSHYDVEYGKLYPFDDFENLLDEFSRAAVAHDVEFTTFGGSAEGVDWIELDKSQLTKLRDALGADDELLKQAIIELLGSCDQKYEYVRLEEL